ncbi:hypothetical protein [Leifsonia xyli]|uniref:hypothetical protein n=1 Tax=Leifsonia xyli TaxID=1575 RepID=UPI003D668B43
MQNPRKHRGDVSGREAAGRLGVDHNSLRKVLHGDTYPDLPFIANAEIKLAKRLWLALKR